MDNRIGKLEVDMVDVKTRLAVAESNIRDIKDDIRSIKDDTKWLRQTITYSIIVAFISGIVGLLFTAL